MRKHHADCCAGSNHPGKTRRSREIDSSHRTKACLLPPAPGKACQSVGNKSYRPGEEVRDQSHPPAIHGELLKFDRTACFFKLLFDCFSFVFSCTFFNCGRYTFNKLLGIHQALTSDVLNFFNDIQFLVAKSG